MGAVYTLSGEVTVYAPSGKLTVSHANGGAVVVTGSQPRWRTAWYIDTIKAARERIRTGQNPQGFLLKSSEPLENTHWHLKTFQAAEDAVKRYRPEKEVGRPATNGMQLGNKYKLWTNRGK